MIESESFDNSLLIGYFGGGNYGDELLLETLLNMFSEAKRKNIAVRYAGIDTYKTYHHDFGYKLVEGANNIQVLKQIVKRRNIIIGGGGLWGLDFNNSVFILSLVLFLSRHVLRKKIYLFGVGFYNSTSKYGRLGAFFAGKAANQIIVRDPESHKNFQRFSNHVSLEPDIAWNIADLNLDKYLEDYALWARDLQIKPNTTLVTFRRFRGSRNDSYKNLISKMIKDNPKHNFVLTLLEPRAMDQEQYIFIHNLSEANENVQHLPEVQNPFSFYLLLANHSHDLRVIAPQFHAIITAQLVHVPFLPVAYDNKVDELLESLNLQRIIAFNDLSYTDLRNFISTHGLSTG